MDAKPLFEDVFVKKNKVVRVCYYILSVTTIILAILTVIMIPVSITLKEIDAIMGTIVSALITTALILMVIGFKNMGLAIYPTKMVVCNTIRKKTYDIDLTTTHVDVVYQKRSNGDYGLCFRFYNAQDALICKYQFYESPFLKDKVIEETRKDFIDNLKKIGLTINDKCGLPGCEQKKVFTSAEDMANDQRLDQEKCDYVRRQLKQRIMVFTLAEIMSSILILALCLMMYFLDLLDGGFIPYLLLGIVWLSHTVLALFIIIKCQKLSKLDDYELKETSFYRNSPKNRP